LFEPFFTTKGQREGAGLGLSAVYGMIEQHDGFVRVSSEPGQGARFEVYLPNLAEAPEVSSFESMRTRGSETILVVDNEIGPLRLIAETLRNSGYTVLEIGDSAEALAMAKWERPRVDLLLTDVEMPNVNGRELADAWRNSHPDLKVLFMSGGQLAGPEEQLLQKPFSGFRLTQTVREVLDGAR
jgi:CheY-like chemotaxis protein